MEFVEIIKFWFEEIPSSSWWKKDENFDQEIKKRFGKIHQAARQCELWEWRKDPQGRLAEIIVLDQFSRNMFRNSPLAFACDPLALGLAQEAVALGEDQKLETKQRLFLYMPYMHSESLKVHDQALEIFKKLGLKDNLDFEIRHREIIERFGRYPHRNQILDRDSTEEEIQFLNEPGSSF